MKMVAFLGVGVCFRLGDSRGFGGKSIFCCFVIFRIRCRWFFNSFALCFVEID